MLSARFVMQRKLAASVNLVTRTMVLTSVLLTVGRLAINATRLLRDVSCALVDGHSEQSIMKMMLELSVLIKDSE
jgi:hypothetical protein